MDKHAFLEELKGGLSGLPEGDIAECLAFYGEMIEDKMEEGATEAEAVAALGSVEDIVTRVVASTPLARLVGERLKPRRRLTAVEITLLVLGSPLWFSLLAAVLSVLLAVFVTIWSVAVCLWATFVSLGACALGGLLCGALLTVFSNAAAGVALIGCGVALAGVSIFFFHLARLGTWAVAWLCRITLLGIKRFFVRKGDAQ